MNIDSKGTLPGLVGGAKAEPKKLSIKCKNEFCNSNQAVEVTPNLGAGVGGVPHNRTYQCCICNCVWTVSTGGFVNL